jgi:glutamate dehydrogenase/leucine dehydrogenase
MFAVQSPAMKELLKKFEEKRPEIVFEWQDAETEAEGWVVINSLRGGAAGGGTRMRKGLNKREVESLAKTMEVKFTVSGPQIGGAKSGINFDPTDPRKSEVLKRWFKAVIPILKNYYGTGGDMHVDEITEVIPYTEDYGLWHPQEGIVNGHFASSDNLKIKTIGQLRAGVSKIVEDIHFTPSPEKKFAMADLITGYGVAMSLIHYYQIWGGDISTKKAIIQGWGNVGAAAGFYLAKAGVQIVAIIDGHGGVINPAGYSLQEVIELMINRDGHALRASGLMSFAKAQDKIWDTGAEIFIPAAGSRLVTRSQIQRLMKNGLEVITSGANVPFDDEEIFFGPTINFADDNVSVIPDFIANCGMARVFAYLMQENAELTDEAIFADTSATIREALVQVHERNHASTGITKKALELSIGKLV